MTIYVLLNFLKSIAQDLCQNFKKKIEVKITYLQKDSLKYQFIGVKP